MSAIQGDAVWQLVLLARSNESSTFVMRTAAKTIAQVVAWTLEAIGLFGIPDDLAAAHAFFAAMQPYLDSVWIRVPMAIIGTGFLVFFYGSLVAKNRFNRQVTQAGGRTGREYPANYIAWDQVDPLAVWQIAWLWNGLEPQDGSLAGTPAYPTFQRLKADLSAGVLPGKRDKRGSWIWTRLARKTLCSYANSRRERPLFLFPEDRKERWFWGSQQKKPTSVLREPLASAIRDVWLLEAIFYIAAGEWDRSDEWPITGEVLSKLGQAQNDVRQRALDEDLPIWGRRVPSGPLEKIPPDYWKYYGFDWFSLLKGEKDEFRTEVKEPLHSISHGVYHSLMTSRSKVEELWHAANT